MRIEMTLNVLKALNDEKTLTTTDLIQTLNISSSTVDYVVRRLKENNLIVTKRGYGGGFKLAKPYKEITVGDITPLLNTKDVFYLALSRLLKSTYLHKLEGFS